jgi:Protein of unknown function (DUF2934)
MPGQARRMVPEEPTTMESPQTIVAVGSREQETAVAAYYLWQQRGCPTGSDQEDWFRAEALLKDPKNTEA